MSLSFKKSQKNEHRSIFVRFRDVFRSSFEGPKIVNFDHILIEKTLFAHFWSIYGTFGHSTQNIGTFHGFKVLFGQFGCDYN